MSSVGLMPIGTAHSEPLQAATFEEIYQVTNFNTALLSSGVSPLKNTFVTPRAVYKRTVTAYTSSPHETDSTPFITASGNHVRTGTIAANWLPFGTAVRIPELFGDQIFIVEDRMNSRYPHRLDIWFTDRGEALKFGMRTATIEVL